jgi:hypothetical protein
MKFILSMLAIITLSISSMAVDNFGYFEPGEYVTIDKNVIGTPSIEAWKEYIELAGAKDMEGIGEKVKGLEWFFFYESQTSALIIKCDVWNGVYKVRIQEGLFKGMIAFIGKSPSNFK